MKIKLVFACAASVLALSAFGATTAAAENAGGTFEITSGPVFPGSQVLLDATCDAPEFAAPAPFRSNMLLQTELVGEKDENGVWHMTGVSSVPPGAKPGAYSAAFQCGDQDVVTNFELVADGTPPGTGVDDGTPEEKPEAKPDTKPDTKPEAEPAAAQPKAKPQVPVKPKGAADTGSLDHAADTRNSAAQNTATQHTAAQATDSGPDAVMVGTGAVALLAAGGLGVWAYRRRQSA